MRMKNRKMGTTIRTICRRDWKRYWRKRRNNILKMLREKLL